MKVLKIVVPLLFLTPSFANAENQKTGEIQITQVENWVAGEGLFIKTSQTNLTNPANCTVTDRYFLPGSSSEVSRSMILSAIVTNQAVDLTIYGDACSSNRPQIVAVAFEG